MGSGRAQEEKEAESEPAVRRPSGDPDHATGNGLSNRSVAGALGGDAANPAMAVALAGGAGNRAVATVAASAGAMPMRPTWYSSADPLGPYTVLKAANPPAYAALAATADQHTIRAADQTNQQGTDSAAAAGWRTRTEVPVAALIRPPLPPAGALAPLRDLLWPLLSGTEQDPKAIAAVISNEVVARWTMRNSDLLGGQVAVRLLLPDEAPPAPWLATPERGIIGIGQQDVLEFTFDGRRIRTSDGSLDVVSLDLLGSNDLEASVGDVAAEVAVVAEAADLLRATNGIVENETRYWQEVASDPDNFAANDVMQHISLLQLTLIVDEKRMPEGGYDSPWGWKLQEFLKQHPEYVGDFATSLDALSALTTSAVEAFRAFADRHNGQIEPDVELSEMRPDIDAAKERAGKEWDEGSQFVAVCDYMGWALGEALWGTANLATGGYYDARHQGQVAFRDGKISKKQFDELDQAASNRALASLAVFTALSLVTAGLAGPILGTTAGLGQTMLYSGLANAAVTAGTMTTTSIYTRQEDMADPTTQGIWRRGAYSPGQILTGAAISGVIGAAVPVAGMALSKLLGWLRAAPVAPEVALALRQAGQAAPELPPPAGWASEEIAPGMLRLTNESVPGEIILTRTSLRYQTPTGTGGMHVEFELPLSGSAGPVAGPKALPPGEGGDLPALPPGEPAVGEPAAGGPQALTPAEPAGGNGGALLPPEDIAAALGGGFKAEGPLTSTPLGATVLEIGSGPAPADLGIGEEPFVRIVRTDIEETFPIDRVVNAEKELAADLVESAQAIIINNPYKYVPNLEELGKAVRPGGKIIIQGHEGANKFFRQLLAKGPPKGFVVSAQEGYNAGSLDPGTPEVQRNIMGGPFRYTNKPEGGPMPNTRVVYEKPILGPEKLGEKLALNSKGQGSRFDYICRGLNALQLGQQNAASAAEAATKGIGLRLWRATVGEDVVLASVMPGRGKPVLIVKPDGTVVRGIADIAPKAELDVNEPWTLTIVGEDAPLLPGR